MNAARPTAAQQSWAQADTYARIQLDTQSLRRDFRADAREPVKHLRVVDAPIPSAIPTLVEVAKTVVGLSVLGAVFLATLWAVDLYNALQGVK